MAPKAYGKRKRSGYPKSDLRYWQDVVYKPRYRDGLESNNYVVRIGFAEPSGWEVHVTDLTAARPSAQFWHEGAPRLPASREPGLRVGLDCILELAVPFALLLVKPHQPVQFFVELRQGTQSRDRAPREGAIHLTCPSPDFEQIMWDV